MTCTCGFANESGARFCGNCGSPLADGQGLSPEGRPVVTPQPRRGSPTVRVVLAVAVLLSAAVPYWWFNRPPGAYVVDNGGLFPITAEGKHGFMDASGKTVIAPQFDGALGFSEGLSAVLVGSKYGYIDRSGTIVVTPQFEEANQFRYGRAVVKLAQESYGIIDKSGKVIATFRWAAGWFSGRYLAVLGQEGLSFVDRSARVVIKGDFTELPGGDGFVDGLAPAALSDRWGFIDTGGRWAIRPQFEQAGPFSDGLASVVVGGRVGFIDRGGRFVINPQYDPGPMRKFSSGLAVIYKNGKSGVVDSRGTIRVEPAYEYIGDFHDGLAPFMQIRDNLRMGFLGPDGHVAIQPEFDSASGFINGLASVRAVGKEAYITKSGTFVVNPFEGLTIAQERERLADEARKAEEAVKAAEAKRVAEAEREAAQIAQRLEAAIVGRWVGRFGANTAAQLVIVKHGDEGAALENDGWREVLLVEFLAADRIRLTGTSVTATSPRRRGTYSLDTLELQLAADGMSLTGRFNDAAGATGAVSLRKAFIDRAR